MSKPDPKDAATSLREDRATVVAVLEGVAAHLDRRAAAPCRAAGEPTSPAAAHRPTRSSTAPVASSTGDGSPVADRIRAAVATLKEAGWTVQDATYTDDPYPNARLEKDGLELSLDPDALRGSDAVTFGLAGECIRTAKGQDADFSGQERPRPAGLAPSDRLLHGRHPVPAGAVLVHVERAGGRVDADGRQRPVPQHGVGVGQRVPAHAAVRSGGGSSRRTRPRGLRHPLGERGDEVVAAELGADADGAGEAAVATGVGHEVVGAHQHAVVAGSAVRARPGTTRWSRRRHGRRPRSGTWRPTWAARRSRSPRPPTTASSRIARESRWTGWPISPSATAPASFAWWSMLSITPTPRSLTPILAEHPELRDGLHDPAVRVRDGPREPAVAHRVVPVPGLHGDRRPARRQRDDGRALGLAGRVRGDQDLGARVDRRDRLDRDARALGDAGDLRRRAPARPAGWSATRAPTRGRCRTARSPGSRTACGSGRRCRRSRSRTARRAPPRARGAAGRTR